MAEQGTGVPTALGGRGRKEKSLDKEQERGWVGEFTQQAGLLSSVRPAYKFGPWLTSENLDFRFSTIPGTDKSDSLCLNCTFCVTPFKVPPESLNLVSPRLCLFIFSIC